MRKRKRKRKRNKIQYPTMQHHSVPLNGAPLLLPAVSFHLLAKIRFFYGKTFLAFLSENICDVGRVITVKVSGRKKWKCLEVKTKLDYFGVQQKKDKGYQVYLIKINFND